MHTAWCQPAEPLMTSKKTDGCALPTPHRLITSPMSSKLWTGLSCSADRAVCRTLVSSDAASNVVSPAAAENFPANRVSKSLPPVSHKPGRSRFPITRPQKKEVAPSGPKSHHLAEAPGAARASQKPETTNDGLVLDSVQRSVRSCSPSQAHLRAQRAASS